MAMESVNASICSNKTIHAWIESLCREFLPEKVYWVTGTEQESEHFNQQLVNEGVFTKLDETKFPNSFWSISDPTDVARVEERTFICSSSQEDSGPTNFWMAPEKAYKLLSGLMSGCMKGRTLYVIPYLMGPVNSQLSKFGVEVTDSLYVVANMRIMARVGVKALEHFEKFGGAFVKGIHSVGTLDSDERYICHFPEDNTIISFNSNYGGNALLGKKCFALRIASSLAKNEGWLAEHMLILGIKNPQGKKIYVSAAFPSACGKTNLAMLIPPQEYRDAGWEVTTVGDDIAWISPGHDGRWYAINPEAGFFGVAPGTSEKTNPNALATCMSNTIFTNTALDTDTLTPWWEGLCEAPEHLKDWNGREWSREVGKPAAHPNSRFTAPACQCPSMDPLWESPQGVPISAFIFGGRRARTAPLVFETRTWNHGVFAGATMASERTAAAAGKVGELRRDPMAMKPFIGYHVGDYFRHWISMGEKAGEKAPRVFHVNWFKTDDKGKFIWPGFTDNMRVLEWIFNRIDGGCEGYESPVGILPFEKDLNLKGLSLSKEKIQELFSIKQEDWKEEIESQKEFLTEIGAKVPSEIWSEHHALKTRLGL